MSMYIEFVSIITCRVLYLAFRPHRFVVGFGYGEAMTSVALLVMSMFIEIAFEAVVDCFALAIEYEHGIRLSKFWEMWRMNGSAFWGLHIFDGFAAIWFAIWAFKLIPNTIFCTSAEDPCSCVGGGFEIYAKLCSRRANTTFHTNSTLEVNSTLAGSNQVQNEFVGIFDALSGDATTVIISIAVIAVVASIFAITRAYQQSQRAASKVVELEEAEKAHGTFGLVLFALLALWFEREGGGERGGEETKKREKAKGERTNRGRTTRE